MPRPTKATTNGSKADSTANLGFEAKLWLAADKLRNNMDAAEYKHVVLGLIFLKYISDTFEEHHAKLKAGKGDYAGANPEDPDEYKAENVFWVPADARWSHLQANAKQPTIGKTVDDAMVAIERDNPRLKGVLPKDYARPGLDKHRLGELIDLIATISLTAATLPHPGLLGRFRTIEHVVLDRAGDGHHLVNQPLLHFQVFEGGLQVARDGVEVRFIQARQVGVRLAQVFSSPGRRAAKGSGEKLLLLAPLLVHVDVLEEVVHALVRQHLDVKGLHRRVNGRLAAEPLIQAVLARRLELGATVIVGEGIGQLFIHHRDRRIHRLAADGANGVGLAGRGNAGSRIRRPG